MDILDTQTLIFHLFRRKCYNSMLTICKEALIKHGNEVSFNFYHALALVLNERYQEAVQHFTVLKSENGTRLASVVMLMYMNKLLKNKDKDLYADLDGELRETKKTTDAVDFYNTGYALFVLGKLSKSLDYVEKGIKLDPNYGDCYNLKGWIYIYLSREQKVNLNISDLFRNALKENVRNLDGTIGLCESLNIENNLSEALSQINKAIVRFPSSVLPLIAKMDLLFSSQDWEQTVEIFNRIFDLDANNHEAIKTNILVLICRDSNYEEAAILIKKFCNELENREPKNPHVLLEHAQLFSRICSRNISVLSETFKMSERASAKSRQSPQILTEMGNQCLLQGDSKEAHRYFRAALKVNDSHIDALIGSSTCELLEGSDKDRIKDQLDFLFELQENHIPSLLYYLKARVSDDENLKFLNQAKDSHTSFLKFQKFGVDYLKSLNPEFLIDLIEEYLKFVPFSFQTKNKLTKIQEEALENALGLLKLITSALPSFERALNSLAKITYFKGDTAEATKIIEKIIKRENNSSEAYLLMAQIHILKKMYDRAAQNLEAGLSCNFKIRENALFHLIAGMIEKNKGNYEDAVKYLTTALNLVELPQKNVEYSLADKATVHIELILVYDSMGHAHDARRLLQDAVEEFKGTAEEAKVILLSADHLLKNMDHQTAVDMLNKVKAGDGYYLEARTKLAQIYLKQRKDKQAYLQCYQEMIEYDARPESYVLLGDAYLNILELEKALESYDRALKMSPKNPQLTKKMGQALVITHNYEKAIAYYLETIKLTDDPEMKLELVNLYMKFDQTSNAEDFLKLEIDAEKNRETHDVTSLKYLINLCHLLARIYEKAGDIKEALDALTSACDSQLRLNKLYSVQNSELPDDELNASVDLYKKMAELANSLREHSRAIKFYKDALVISVDDVKILACLAKLHMQLNQLELCQQTCNVLLSVDNENEDGTVLMADIAFRKVDFDMAIYHYTQLLAKQPTNWRALVRFIEIMRRTGNLQDVGKYMDTAESLISAPSKHPGFSYCLGLYQWYTGNLNGALRNFNVARQNAEWNRLAIYNMIEICLNPEEEILGEHLIDIDDIEYRDSRSMALKTAERLLKELKMKLEASGEDYIRYKLLSNFLLLATKEKPAVESALEDLINLASQDRYKDHVGPILGIATAHTLLKQSQRAKNQLKRVSKTVWSFEDAEYLERCWLLLADYYVQSSKYDLALELLKKILQHNRACCKAHEFYGQIAEKEQKYKDASQMYSLAWKHGGKSSPTIGYRLAYTYMKSKKYADAIDVCQQVLKQHPDYPKIRKDILDKALANLRT